MKIVYVMDSLASKGGAERIVSEKMSWLADAGYEVYIVTCYQDPSTMTNVYPLSQRVNQINLNIPYYSQYHYRYPWRLWVKWRLHRRLLRQLKQTVKRLNPDVLVSMGYFMADVVSSLSCKARKVVEIHEARSFLMSDQGLSRSALSRCFMRLYRSRYLRGVERNADVVVTLTADDARAWAGARRVEVIPNFTMMRSTVEHDVTSRRVIAVGRLEWQKGFDRLVEAWRLIADRHPGWRIDIFGDGTSELALKQQIAEAGLQQSAAIHPFTTNIQEEYARSAILALSSRFEGFGLVLIEAMMVGVPCVVFDCPFGPSEVIVDGQCGFVVADGDIAKFAEKLSQLMADDNMRTRFSASAKERAKCYDQPTIMAQWEQLFDSLS